MAVKPIPDGYHTLTPYLVVDDTAKALDFYKKVFEAVELFRMPMPDGRIGHAEFKIGDSIVMLGDEMPEMNIKGPKSLGGTAVGMMIYVVDCDAIFNKAVAAGATVQQAPTNQFYGDRAGTVVDPFGHKWSIHTHIEDVPPDELARRAAEWGKKQASG
jgi:PhnB protein